MSEAVNTFADPKATLEAHVKMLLFQQLQGDSDKIIKMLVEKALEKGMGSYGGKPTMLEQCMDWEITNAARTIISNELQLRQAQIEEAVKSKLDDAFFAKMLDKISTGLANNLEISFKLGDY